MAASFPRMGARFNSRAPLATLISHLVSLVLIVASLPAEARAPLLDESRGVLTIAPMLEKVTPTVVNISTATTAAVADNPLWRDPFFRRHFGVPDMAPRQELSAAGSGVIGRLYYSASSTMCCAHAISEKGTHVLGAQAGPRQLEEVLRSAGLSSVRRAAENPFNIVFEARR